MPETTAGPTVDANDVASRNRGVGIKLSSMGAALLILGVAWRVHRYALGMPIWGDEAFVAISLLKRNFVTLFEPLEYGQIAPLVFMWAELAATRLLGYSEWALHLVPALAGLAALLGFARFARENLTRSGSVLAVAIMAASYYVVRHSAEVKPYSTDLAISLSLTMLGWSVYRHPRSAGRWAVLIVWSAVAVWCSYPSVFVSGSVLALLAWKGLREKPGWAFAGGVLILGILLCGSGAAMYFLYGKPHAEYAARLFDLPGWSSTFVPILKPWRLPYWFYDVHTGDLFSYPQGGNAPGSILTFALFVVGLIRMWRVNRDLALLLAGPFLLNIVAAAAQLYPYGGSARVAQHLAPAICLLAGVGWADLLARFLIPSKFRAGMLISVIVLALLPVSDMIKTSLKPYKSSDVIAGNRAVRHIADQTGPQDRWIIFNADRKVSYAPYLGDWGGVGGQFYFDVMRFSPVPVRWAPPTEEVAVREDGRLWFLVYYTRREDAPFPGQLLEAYLAGLRERFGEPQVQSFLVKDDAKKGKFEEIRAYAFPPPSG